MVRKLIGKGPVDVVKEIIRLNPQIENLTLIPYIYVPLRLNEPRFKKIRVTPPELIGGKKLTDLDKRLPSQYQVALLAKVRIGKNMYRYLPMMDFDIPKSKRNLKIVIERLKKHDYPNGWILETDKSYHFYGYSLLTTKEYWKFLANSLLTSIVITRDNIIQVADPRFIGHSMKRGACDLRLTTRADKSFKPKVVAFFSHNI